MASNEIIAGVLKNQALTVPFALKSPSPAGVGDEDIFKTNPTFAAGDAKYVAFDSGTPGSVTSCTNTPTVVGADRFCYLTLTADEMNHDAIMVIIQDQTGTEDWQAHAIMIYTSGTLPILRSTTPANSIAVDSSGRIDVGKWLGTAVTLSSNSLPQIDVESIDGSTTSGANLKSFTDSTSTPSAYLPVNLAQISGDATAADNLESYCDGGDNMQVHVVEYTSSFDFSSTMKTSIQTAVTTSLNTAIPGSPTADSVFERVKAIDDLTQSGGNGDLAAILVDTGTSGVKIDLTQSLSFSPTTQTVGEVLASQWSNIRGKVVRSSTTVTYYKPDNSTALFTRTLDSASNPTSITGN